MLSSAARAASSFCLSSLTTASCWRRSCSSWRSLSSASCCSCGRFEALVACLRPAPAARAAAAVCAGAVLDAPAGLAALSTAAAAVLSPAVVEAAAACCCAVLGLDLAAVLPAVPVDGLRAVLLPGRAVLALVPGRDPVAAAATWLSDCAMDVLRDCCVLCCAGLPAASSATEEATEPGPFLLPASSPDPGLTRCSLPAELLAAAWVLGEAEGTRAGTTVSGSAPLSQASLLQGSGSSSCCQLL